MWKLDICYQWIVRVLLVIPILSFNTYAAVTLDRTRLFSWDVKSINIKITNDNPEEAYLAQSWIEDQQGKKLTKGALLRRHYNA